MNCLNNLLLEGKAGVDIRVKACNAAGVGVWISLPLVRAPNKPLTSLSLLPGRGLQ